MDKSNLELFKQAISEGLSEKVDSVVNSYTDEIVCSEKHKLAMRAIVYGKADTKRTLSPKMKRIIAILVAAALLLTSCGIIFRNEIREIFENVYDFFIAVTYTENDSDGTVIDEVYELGYLPNGYDLKNKDIRSLRVKWVYADEQDNIMIFEQRILDGSNFTVDSESGYSQIKEIEEYDVYYRKNAKHNVYVWCDNKYSFYIISDIKLSNSILVQIINGIKI